MTGKTISHYRILDKIGAGGMGVVYKAEDVDLGRLVALKFLHSSEDVTRLLREAKAEASLNHPNICAVHEVNLEHGFIAMELVEGQSLAARMGGRPLPVAEALPLAIQICEGLKAAHDKGITHRDIKSANILVTQDGHAKILDFGLARVAGQTMMTGDVSVAGTPGYMAPEQMRGEPADRRTDIWAVGAVLHEMLTGRLPHGQTDTLPEGLGRIVRKALAEDPSHRYQHIEDLLVDLRAAASAHPPARTTSRRWLIAGAGATGVALAAGGTWLWLNRAPQRSKSRALAVMYFTNLTQDRELDWLNRGLCEMLTTNLSQVKGMDVLSTERIAAVLVRMGKKAMDAGLAPEVARNAGAAAFVTGALMRIGPDSLRLDVRAQDAADGRVLFSEKVEGEDIKAVFRMVDALTARMAERLLPTGDLPGKAPVLEEVTTSNVEAYRHYQLGLEAVWRFEVTRALREFEEAVRLDPQFALAWLEIGKHCARFGPRRRSYEILRDLARQLSRLPRRSQLSLPGLRAWAGYDFDALRRAQEVLLAEFPRETNDRIRLSAAHLRFDRPLEAAEVVEEGLKLDPNDQFLWIQLSYCRVGTGDLPAALEASDRARALLPADPFPLLCRGEILFLAGRDEDAILAARKSLELGPYQDYIALWDLAFFYADQKKFPLAEANLREYVQRSQEPLIHIYEAHLEETRGRLDAARDLYRKAVARLAGDNPDNAGGALMALSHLSHAQGDGASALAFARQQQLDGEENLAISFLEAAGGDAAAAERSLQRYLQARPWLTEAAAGLWRARNQMAAALQRGEAKAVRSFTQPLPVTLECWIPVYQARAALLAADYPAAERLLRRTLFLERWLLTVSGLTQTRSPLVSLMCHYHLGQVHEATGKRDEASKEYHEFLSVFEGSAARLPQVAEARAALKRLGA